MNQVLTQDEINTLLASLSGEEKSPAETSADRGEVRKLELAGQERLVRGRLPALELVNERFARDFRTALSAHLNNNCFATAAGIETMKFGEFMKRLPLPSSLHVFRMPPLSGQALMVFSTPLVFAITESLFGGGGASRVVKMEGREFTPIETRLIGKVAMRALEVLQAAWSPVEALDFVYARSEFNPLAVQLVPASDTVITSRFEIEVDQQSAELLFCIPYAVLEPIREKLRTGLHSARQEHDVRGAERIRRGIEQANVEVRVELARGEVQFRDILKLEVGDTLSLGTGAKDAAKVLIEGKPKFEGYVGKHGGSKAVRVTSALTRK